MPSGGIALCVCHPIPADKELYQRQIEATDRQIDALVYELHGLSEEEITQGEWREIRRSLEGLG